MDQNPQQTVKVSDIMEVPNGTIWRDKDSGILVQKVAEAEHGRGVTVRRLMSNYEPVQADDRWTLDKNYFKDKFTRVTEAEMHEQAGFVTHSTGAKRSETKPHYSSISASFLRRLALIHTGAPLGQEVMDPVTGYYRHGGDLSYGEGNWLKGLPFVDTWGHLMEHLMSAKEAIQRGEQPRNDDLAAAVWNLEVLMEHEATYITKYKAKREKEDSSSAGTT